jgi:protein-tyrosine-phosphatase
MGGSRGKKLFDGIHLVATYFFDAIDANVHGSLTYPGIETSADFQNKPELNIEISKTVHALMSSLLERKRILFLGEHDDIRAQMAGALTQYHAGDRFHVLTAGDEPAQAIHAGVVEAMAEIGVDMAFLQSRSRSSAIQEYRPDIIVAMGNDIEIPAIPNVMTSVWNLPDPQHASSELIVQLREQIRENVTRMTRDRE